MDLETFPPEYIMALRLLIPIWRGLDADYKTKYARSIWQQFEGNVRAAAYTSSLSGFYNRLCSRLTIQIEPQHIGDVHAALAVEASEARRLLRQLRDESATLALMVRIDNEKRRADYAARKGTK